MKFERERLASKFGKESPHVAAIAAQIEARGNLVSALGLERERAGTAVPKTSPREAVLYGRVTNKQGTAVPKVEVLVKLERTDPKSNQSGQAEKTATDSSGRFEIRLSTAEPINVLLELNYGGRLVYRDDEPFKLTPGTATYRELAVDVQDPADAPKPPGTAPRKTAAKSKSK